MEARERGPGLSVLAGADRRKTVEELHALAAELLGRDRAVSELLTLLADAVERNLPEDVRAYASAIPPRAVAEDLTQKHRTIWGVAEVVRGALVLLPIAFTWYGLSAASAAYAQLVTARPELVAQPFLLLWQRGFEGASTVTFSFLAAIDGTLISLIIALSLVIHYKADVRDPRDLARTLLRESQVRALLARCLALSPSAQPAEVDADARVGLGAPGLSDAVLAMRAYAGQLPELVAAVDASTQRSLEAQRALLEQGQRAAEREAALVVALQRIGQGTAVAVQNPTSLVAGAATDVAAEQVRLVEDLRQLLAGLDEVKKAQRVAMGSVTLQTDAMNYMAKALVLASERVQVAAQTLGDAAVPADLFRRLRWRRPGLVLGGVAILAVIVAIALAIAELLR